MHNNLIFGYSQLLRKSLKMTAHIAQTSISYGLIHGKHRRAARRMDSELKRIKNDDATPKSDQKALGHS